MKAVFLREFFGYFRTPVAWVFLSVFLIASVGVPWFLGNFFESNDASLRIVFRFLPWIYLFLIPAVGMRLWSEEKKTGTLELLLTYPVSLNRAIFGKFLAGWLFIGLALLLTFPMPLTVAYLGDPDWGVMASGYLGAFLMSGAYLGVCSACSSLTANSVISFVLGLMACLLLVLLGWNVFGDLLLSLNLPVATVDFLSGFGILPRFQPMVDGVITFPDFIYFLSLTISALCLNRVVLNR
ncbi:MAG: ABC transporter permease subunit [Puniceicoccales bacterium]